MVDNSGWFYMLISGRRKGKTFPSTFYAQFFLLIFFSLLFSFTSSPIRVVFFSISRRNSCGSTANRLEKKLGQVIPSLYNTTLHNSSLPARRDPGKKSRCTGTSCADRVPFFSLSLPSFLSLPLSFPSKNFVTRIRNSKIAGEKVLIARNNARSCVPVPTDLNSCERIYRFGRDLQLRRRWIYDFSFFFSRLKREIETRERRIGRREREGEENSRRRMCVYFSRERWSAVFPRSWSSGGYIHSRRNKRNLCPSGISTTSARHGRTGWDHFSRIHHFRNWRRESSGKHPFSFRFIPELRWCLSRSRRNENGEGKREKEKKKGEKNDQGNEDRVMGLSRCSNVLKLSRISIRLNRQLR